MTENDRLQHRGNRGARQARFQVVQQERLIDGGGGTKSFFVNDCENHLQDACVPTSQTKQPVFNIGIRVETE